MPLEARLGKVWIGKKLVPFAAGLIVGEALTQLAHVGEAELSLLLRREEAAAVDAPGRTAWLEQAALGRIGSIGLRHASSLSRIACGQTRDL